MAAAAAVAPARDRKSLRECLMRAHPSASPGWALMLSAHGELVELALASGSDAAQLMLAVVAAPLDVADHDAAAPCRRGGARRGTLRAARSNSTRNDAISNGPV